MRLLLPVLLLVLPFSEAFVRLPSAPRGSFIQTRYVRNLVATAASSSTGPSLSDSHNTLHARVGARIHVFSCVNWHLLLLLLLTVLPSLPPYHTGHHHHHAPRQDLQPPLLPPQRMAPLVHPSLPACRSSNKLLPPSPPTTTRPKPSTSSLSATGTPPLPPVLPPALLLLPQQQYQQDDACLAVCRWCT